MVINKFTQWLRSTLSIRQEILGWRELNTQQKKYRSKINEIFKLRDLVFFRKKTNDSEKYPYKTIDPFLVFGEENLSESFNLVGKEWSNPIAKKPVAILWGFNNWKWGFVSDYLPEYRTAFAPRKIKSLSGLLEIIKFPIKPSVFIFWGYTESFLIRKYAEKNNIKIYRMEDGFIRSSALGASHSTPYSIVLDEKGLHCNPETPSDLEEILNNYTFSTDDISTAKECRLLMSKLALSKYNPAGTDQEVKNIIKIKKRIAVLGQVDSDIAVKLGNINKWKMLEVIRLAKYENPNAEIIYRPHPEVYLGFQKSKFKSRAVAKICTVESPTIPLHEFLKDIDHVYTITSLSGLEALLLGKTVTTLGAAFYAGWGLTDDRVNNARRNRKLNIDELFSGVYLKYPRYLANLENNSIGFKSACLRIKVDQQVSKYELFNSLNVTNSSEAIKFINSDYWPQLVILKQNNENKNSIESQIKSIDTSKYINSNSGEIQQYTILYALAGAIKSDESKDIFIKNIRTKINPKVLNKFLIDLYKNSPRTYILKQIAWQLSEANDDFSSLKVLSDELENGKNKTTDKNNEHLQSEEELAIEFRKTTPPEKISENEADILLDMFDANINLRNTISAEEIAKKLLLSNYHVSKVIQRMAKLAALKFDFNSALNIAKFGQSLSLYDQNRIYPLIESRSYTEESMVNGPQDFIVSIARLATLKPDKINEAILLLKKFEKYISSKDFDKVISGILFLDNEQSLRKASGFIAIENPIKALEIVENLIANGSNTDGTRIAYSQALSFSNRITEAIDIMSEARNINPSTENYRESLRLLIIAGNYQECLKLIKDAKNRKMELGDMYPRKVYFGCRMVKEALETFSDLSIKRTVQIYFKDKYFDIQATGDADKKLVMLSIFGPGDEIRFASIYGNILNNITQKTLTITCEPRLHSLFVRSFEGIKFLPVPRPRDTEFIDLNNYTEVPGSDLIRVIDNSAIREINLSHHVNLVTDILPICLPEYESFTGKPYLKHDLNIFNALQKRLPKNKKLIGLSWRSSLTSHSRNEHYLDIEQLEIIFSIEGIQFVNLQCDECQEELDWVETRFPGKIINLPDIDQYNDFDSVAALLKCMDLVVAPIVTLVELSGALGCPTWMLSNSSELHWRKRDDSMSDVWHKSMTHLEGQILGNKESLVKALYKNLLEFAKI